MTDEIIPLSYLAPVGHYVRPQGGLFASLKRLSLKKVVHHDAILYYYLPLIDPSKVWWLEPRLLKQYEVHIYRRLSDEPLHYHSLSRYEIFMFIHPSHSMVHQEDMYTDMTYVGLLVTVYAYHTSNTHNINGGYGPSTPITWYGAKNVVVLYCHHKWKILILDTNVYTE